MPKLRERQARLELITVPERRTDQAKAKDHHQPSARLRRCAGDIVNLHRGLRRDERYIANEVQRICRRNVVGHPAVLRENAAADDLISRVRIRTAIRVVENDRVVRVERAQQERDYRRGDGKIERIVPEVRRKTGCRITDCEKAARATNRLGGLVGNAAAVDSGMQASRPENVEALKNDLVVAEDIAPRRVADGRGGRGRRRKEGGDGRQKGQCLTHRILQ